MRLFIRLLAAYNMLVALAVTVKSVFDVPQPDWELLSWLMAPAVVISLAAAYGFKRRFDAYSENAGDMVRFLDVNIHFYAAAVLFVGYGFQWSAYLNDLAWGRSGLSNTGSLWIYVDTLVIMVAAVMGVRMWKAVGKTWNSRAPAI